MYSVACLYRLVEGGVPRGSDWHYKKFLRPRGGGRTLVFTLVSESVVGISKIAKMTKFLFLAQGYVWVEEKKSMCQTEKYIAPRRGGVAIL